MTQELKEIFAYHSRLVSTWETMDGIILTVTLIGFIVLLSLLLSSKCVVTLRQRMVYLAILAGSVFLAALPFAFTDGIFAPVNYLITPALVVGRALFFFVLHFVIEAIQKRKTPAPRQD